ncbi:hypothetical protein [Clostridium sp. UBA6640]|nr:hypothetical protein [Clostridium sp. UBA6640]
MNTVATNFYDCLYRNEELPKDIAEKLVKTVFTGERNIKVFYTT